MMNNRLSAPGLPRLSTVKTASRRTVSPRLAEMLAPGSGRGCRPRISGFPRDPAELQQALVGNDLSGADDPDRFPRIPVHEVIRGTNAAAGRGPPFVRRRPRTNRCWA